MPTKKRKKKSPKKSRKILYKIAAIICIIIAFFFVLSYSNLISKHSKDPIQINSALYLNKQSENLPIRILIPKNNIDLPIVEARIIGGYWELSENTASHGEGSAVPGQKGNVVIFAHAREGLFYNLKDTKTGDSIYVFTKDKWYRYKVDKITNVYPNQIEVIKPTSKETLTLYTCTGFLDEKRLVVTANPQQ